MVFISQIYDREDPVSLENKYKMMFIRTFNHEVRHPVGIIHYYASLIKKELKNDKENNA